MALTGSPDPTAYPLQVPTETLVCMSHPSTVPGHVARFSTLVHTLGSVGSPLHSYPAPAPHPATTVAQVCGKTVGGPEGFATAATGVPCLTFNIAGASLLVSK